MELRRRTKGKVEPEKTRRVRRQGDTLFVWTTLSLCPGRKASFVPKQVTLDLGFERAGRMGLSGRLLLIRGGKGWKDRAMLL